MVQSSATVAGLWLAKNGLYGVELRTVADVEDRCYAQLVVESERPGLLVGMQVVKEQGKGLTAHLFVQFSHEPAELWLFNGLCVVLMVDESMFCRNGTYYCTVASEIVALVDGKVGV